MVSNTTEQESVVDIDSLELCSLPSTWHQSVCDCIPVALVSCARCRSEECVHHSVLVEERLNLYWWLTNLFQQQLKMDEWDLDMDGLKTTEQDREERFNLKLVLDKLVSGPVEDG